MPDNQLSNCVIQMPLLEVIQTFSRLGETIELYHINIYIFRFKIVAIQAKTNSKIVSEYDQEIPESSNLTVAVSVLPGGTASKVFLFYFTDARE